MHWFPIIDGEYFTGQPLVLALKVSSRTHIHTHAMHRTDTRSHTYTRHAHLKTDTRSHSITHETQAHTHTFTFVHSYLDSFTHRHTITHIHSYTDTHSHTSLNTKMPAHRQGGRTCRLPYASFAGRSACECGVDRHQLAGGIGVRLSPVQLPAAHCA